MGKQPCMWHSAWPSPACALPTCARQLEGRWHGCSRRRGCCHRRWRGRPHSSRLLLLPPPLLLGWCGRLRRLCWQRRLYRLRLCRLLLLLHELRRRLLQGRHGLVTVTDAAHNVDGRHLRLPLLLPLLLVCCWCCWWLRLESAAGHGNQAVCRSWCHSGCCCWRCRHFFYNHRLGLCCRLSRCCQPRLGSCRRCRWRSLGRRRRYALTHATGQHHLQRLEVGGRLQAFLAQQRSHQLCSLSSRLLVLRLQPQGSLAVLRRLQQAALLAPRGGPAHGTWHRGGQGSQVGSREGILGQGPQATRRNAPATPCFLARGTTTNPSTPHEQLRPTQGSQAHLRSQALT